MCVLEVNQYLNLAPLAGAGSLVYRHGTRPAAFSCEFHTPQVEYIYTYRAELLGGKV